MSDGKETLGAPLLGARTANPRLFTGARARDLEEGTGDDDDATTTTTTTMTSSARRYAHRRDMFMSGRDRDLEDAQQAEARDQLSDWAQMLRSLSRTRRGTEAADAVTAEASRHALKTATRAGFHRARVDLYEGSNLDTPENEQTRRTAEARSSMGRAATIALRWVLVVLIVLAAVLVAFGIHECSRWGQHATRLATELAYNKSGVCWQHTSAHILGRSLTAWETNRKRAGQQSQRSRASAHCLLLLQGSSCGVSTPHSRAASTRFSATSTASWSTMFATKPSSQTHMPTLFSRFLEHTELWTKPVPHPGPRSCTGDSEPNGSRTRGSDARDRRTDRGRCRQLGDKKRCQRV